MARELDIGIETARDGERVDGVILRRRRPPHRNPGQPFAASRHNDGAAGDDRNRLRDIGELSRRLRPRVDDGDWRQPGLDEIARGQPAIIGRREDSDPAADGDAEAIEVGPHGAGEHDPWAVVVRKRQ